jgi:hypothetical protein
MRGWCVPVWASEYLAMSWSILEKSHSPVSFMRKNSLKLTFE